MKTLAIVILVTLILTVAVSAGWTTPKYKVLESYCKGAACYVKGCADLWCNNVRVFSVSMYVQSQAAVGRYCSFSNYYLRQYHETSCQFSLPYGAYELRGVW